jgi:hypothetical protein
MLPVLCWKESESIFMADGFSSKKQLFEKNTRITGTGLVPFAIGANHT